MAEPELFLKSVQYRAR